MATFALGAGNLISVDIVTDTGTSSTETLVYTAPSGFYAELCDVSFESGGATSEHRVIVRKRLVSSGNYVNYGIFESDGGLNLLPNIPVDGAYTGAADGSGTDLAVAYFWSKSSGNGFILYPGDKIYVRRGNTPSEWRVRLVFNIYKNP